MVLLRKAIRKANQAISELKEASKDSKAIGRAISNLKRGGYDLIAESLKNGELKPREAIGKIEHARNLLAAITRED